MIHILVIFSLFIYFLLSLRIALTNSTLLFISKFGGLFVLLYKTFYWCLYIYYILVPQCNDIDFVDIYFSVNILFYIESLFIDLSCYYFCLSLFIICFFYIGHTIVSVITVVTFLTIIIQWWCSCLIYWCHLYIS